MAHFNLLDFLFARLYILLWSQLFLEEPLDTRIFFLSLVQQFDYHWFRLIVFDFKAHSLLSLCADQAILVPIHQSLHKLVLCLLLYLVLALHFFAGLASFFTF